MTETKNKGNNKRNTRTTGKTNTRPAARANETPRQREARLKMQRKRRRRQQQRNRILQILGIVGVIVVVTVLWVIIGRVSEEKKPEPEPVKEEVVVEETPTTKAIDLSEVLHLSFDSLIAIPESAFIQNDLQRAKMVEQSYLTVDEFNMILQQLYDSGYILVRIKDLENPEQAQLPIGKKPLIISQQDVNYDLRLNEQGFSSKLIIDQNGNIINERQRLDGSLTYGALDVIPCVEEFVKEHPDFSYNGAKGIIGLTGYQGILGYRTTPYLGVSEGNPYVSSYGLFNTEEETVNVQAVVEALRNAGWEFACNGYERTSYNTSLETVQSDLTMWKQSVENIIGPVDILMYPMGNDLNYRQEYSENDPVFTYLRDSGFKYFCAMDMGGPWTSKTDVVRCNYMLVDGYAMYCEMNGISTRFQGILDFGQIYDETRQSAGTVTPEPETTE